MTNATIHQPGNEDANSSSSSDPINKALQNGLAAIQKKGQSNNSNNTGNSTEGKCANSKSIDGRYQCNDTYNWITNSQLINQVGQAGGSAAVGVTNQLGAIKAQTAGTQSAVMESAAKSQENAGLLQTALGVANLGMGYFQIKRANQHGDQAKAIENQNVNADGKNLTNYASDSLQGKIIDASGQTANVEAARANPTDLKTRQAAALAANRYGKKAIDEQTTAQSDSMAAGVRSLITGTQMTLSGALAIGAAKQAKELAGKLSDVTGNNYQLTSTNPDTGTTAPSSTTALSTGTASDPAVAATDPNSAGGDVPKIDTPTNPDATDSGPGAGPVAGSFQPGATKGAGNGGGGGGGIGVGSMSPAKAEAEQTGPRMADSRLNTAYSQGGGSGYAGAGGGVSADKSADLGFLANLLPKPQDEMGKNGILDYGTAGRSPASMAPYSFLGKDVNIFQRISDRTTTKLKSGDVGSIGGS
jgi:hypothetical protein